MDRRQPKHTKIKEGKAQGLETERNERKTTDREKENAAKDENTMRIRKGRSFEQRETGKMRDRRRNRKKQKEIERAREGNAKHRDKKESNKRVTRRKGQHSRKTLDWT